MPSRDGIHFDHSWIYAGVPLLPPDWNEYHFMTSASEVITRGGYHWIFYDRNDATHEHRWGNQAEIVVARWHEGRIVSVRPSDENGYIITRSFEFDEAQNIYIDLTACGASSEVAITLQCECSGQSSVV